jgi:Uma2 family endonuclease
MSAALLLPPEILFGQPRRKRFTQGEVRRLAEIGFFDGQRYELIEGDLIDKTGQNPRHANTIRLIAAWLAHLFSFEQVQAQLPIELACQDLDRSCPEPDIAVLVQSSAEYDNRHPRGDELLLIVEVADTSAHLDLSIKAGLYARARVSEYWVLDVVRRVLVVHRHPEQGSYRRVMRLGEGEQISLECRAGHVVTISDLMPAKP